MNKYRSQSNIQALVYWVGILFTLFFVLFPLYWIALTAFKTHADALTTKVIFEPTLNNFRLLFAPPFNFSPMLFNSIVISVATVLLAVPLGTMAAYAFSRYSFRGKDVLLVTVLATQFLPAVVIILPYFIQFRNLGLLDTRIGLIILHVAFTIPFATWLVKGFADSLPQEIEEAALVDGASELNVLRYVTAPLLMPGIITVAALSFIGSWNEFLFAFILTTNRARPMMVGLVNLIGMGGTPWERLAAAGLLVMIPVFLISLSIRRYFVEGLTMGAVK